MRYYYFVSRAKIYNKKRYAEKIEVKKKIRMHEERQTKSKREDVVPKGAVPAYLLDRYTAVM
jgi:ribosome biogenesis protein NSA2